LEVLSFIAIGYGVWLIYPPVAIIVWGIEGVILAQVIEDGSPDA